LKLVYNLARNTGKLASVVRSQLDASEIVFRNSDEVVDVKNIENRLLTGKVKLI
jgi:hypothetical protein